MVDASKPSIEAYVRTNLSTLALLLAVLLTAGKPLFAAEGPHQGCPDVQQPHCHKAAQISQCCGDDRDVSNSPGILEARIDVAADHQAAVSVVPSTPEALQSSVTAGHLDSSPSHGRTLDLPTLLADLRL